MNGKLFYLIRNALISIALSFIFSGCIGYFHPETTYFYLHTNGKTEISFEEYKYGLTDSKSDYLKLSHFNMDIAFPTGLVSCGISFLLLTGIETIKGKNYIKAI